MHVPVLKARILISYFSPVDLIISAGFLSLEGPAAAFWHGIWFPGFQHFQFYDVQTSLFSIGRLQFSSQGHSILSKTSNHFLACLQPVAVLQLSKQRFFIQQTWNVAKDCFGWLQLSVNCCSNLNHCWMRGCSDLNVCKRLFTEGSSSLWSIYTLLKHPEMFKCYLIWCSVQDAIDDSIAVYFLFYVYAV